MNLYESDFKENKADFVFHDLEFIGTCSACPEQYDVVIRSHEGDRYQVGYVRLRYGKLYCAFPDVGGNIVYRHNYNDNYLGVFPSPEQRMFHLEAIALKLKQTLDGISYEYS